MDKLSQEEVVRLFLESQQKNSVLESQNNALTELVRPSTLLEYLSNCHNHMYTKFKVQPNPTLTTKGGLTSMTNKKCPTMVQPWTGFLEEQREMFADIVDILSENEQLFEPSVVTNGYGARLDRYVGSERDLERFFHTAVEEPVGIISQVMAANADRLGLLPKLGIDGGVEFENHINVLNEEGEALEQVEGRAGTETAPPAAAPKTPPDQRDPSPGPSAVALRPDQICVYKTAGRDGDAGKNRVLAFVEEYKSPAKLRSTHIRAALGENRPPLIISNIINDVKIPSKDDATAHFEYVARRLTTVALTQVYHYMLHAGIERGVMTTGELLYHVAEPGPETAAKPEDLPYCSAVGQLLAFTLCALKGNGPRGQDRRDLVISEASVWEVDWELILHQLKQEKVDPKPPPSSDDRYKPATYRELDRSLIGLRKKKRIKYYDDTSLDVSPARREDDGHSSDEDVGGGPGNAPSSSRARKRSPTSPLAQRTKTARLQSTQSQSRQQQESQRQAPAEDSWKTLPYCTHKCLHGLVTGGPLDHDCPNAGLHYSRVDRDDGAQQRHAISHAEFLVCLAEQMRRTLDSGIAPLPQIGARGILFRVVLLEYGYALVAKGTRSGLTVPLCHEAQVYERLRPLQGVCVPVCLGTIDLRDVGRRYYYDITTQIVFFVLLSWAGVNAHDAALAEDRKDKLIGRQVAWAARCVRALGVSQNDMSDANTMWDEATGRVMLIDYERATLLSEPCSPVRAKQPYIGSNADSQGRGTPRKRLKVEVDM